MTMAAVLAASTLPLLDTARAGAACRTLETGCDVECDLTEALCVREHCWPTHQPDSIPCVTGVKSSRTVRTKDPDYPILQ